MRITNGMMSKNMLNNLQLNMKRMNKLNAQGTSGKLFDKPSDAPVEMARSLKLYTDISRVEQYERNVRDAQSWLHTTEDAVSEVTEILQRTRELSVDMANGAKTESDTQKAAMEISQLKDQLIKLANTTHAGRSIFTGYQTDKDLLDENGIYLTNLDSKQTSVYNVGISEQLNINTLGSNLFGVASGSGVNVLVKVDAGSRVEVGTIEVPVGADELSLEGAFGSISGASWPDLNIISPNGEKFGFGEAFLNSGGSIEDTLNTSSTKAIYNGFSSDKESMKFESPIPGEWKVEVRNDGGAESSTFNIKSNYNIDTEGFENSYSAEMLNSPISTEGQKSYLVNVFDKLISAMGLNSGGATSDFDQEEISNLIGSIDDLLENALTIKAEVGSKTNRLDMTSERLTSEHLNFTTTLSENEDVDLSEVIMKFNMAEAIYNASLSMGGRSIQRTLVDFLR